MTNIKESSPVNMPYLPDDLLLNCLARVSRFYYPTLSLVSKRFRSLVASADIYQTRTLLGCTESCLYVCLRFNSEANQHWFTLCPRLTRTPNPNPNPILNLRRFTSCFRPQRNLTNHTRKKEKKSSKSRLVSVQTRKFSPTFWSSHATIGYNIYMIGECCNTRMNVVSPRVYFMDCRYHTFHKAPSMRMTTWSEPLVSVVDGKIYVVKTNTKVIDSMIEFFDPKTQIWEHVPSPSVEIDNISRSLVLDGKLYLFGDKKMVYKPKENKWDVVGSEIPLRWFPSNTSCVVDNVIYSYGIFRELKWYDSETRSWILLKGLEEHSLPFPEVGEPVRLVNYGGKIVALWEKKAGCIGPKKKKINIWCAKISLERRSEKEIYGKIEWCNVVLTLSEPYELVQVITTTV
ncbi:putative F-box/kelch-repeat protein [Cardamine amara subsp. amara]|uniref:F-box/kelch-repeat protein n=1 Tax=Cardamine amara subsp. amara TaxID=228776 RepID=A0ABD1B780_CARAN